MIVTTAPSDWPEIQSFNSGGTGVKSTITICIFHILLPLSSHVPTPRRRLGAENTKVPIATRITTTTTTTAPPPPPPPPPCSITRSSTRFVARSLDGILLYRNISSIQCEARSSRRLAFVDGLIAVVVVVERREFQGCRLKWTKAFSSLQASSPPPSTRSSTPRSRPLLPFLEASRLQCMALYLQAPSVSTEGGYWKPEPPKF